MSVVRLSLLVFFISTSVAMAQEPQPCQPRATHLTAAKLWWSPLDSLPTTAQLKAYVLERSTNQGRFQPLIELPPTAGEYVDGVERPLRPGNNYEWRLSIRWTLPTGEDVLSPVGPYGAPAPCLQILGLPAPTALQAEPILP